VAAGEETGEVVAGAVLAGAVLVEVAQLVG